METSNAIVKVMVSQSIKVRKWKLPSQAGADKALGRLRKWHRWHANQPSPSNLLPPSYHTSSSINTCSRLVQYHFTKVKVLPDDWRKHHYRFEIPVNNKKIIGTALKYSVTVVRNYTTKMRAHICATCKSTSWSFYQKLWPWLSQQYLFGHSFLSSTKYLPDFFYSSSILFDGWFNLLPIVWHNKLVLTIGNQFIH